MFIALLTRERKPVGRYGQSWSFIPHIQASRVLWIPFHWDVWTCGFLAISSLPICNASPFQLSAAAVFYPVPLCSSTIGFEETCSVNSSYIGLFYFAEVLVWIQPTMCIKNKIGDQQKMSELSASVKALRKNRFCLKALCIHNNNKYFMQIATFWKQILTS